MSDKKLIAKLREQPQVPDKLLIEVKKKKVRRCLKQKHDWTPFERKEIGYDGQLDPFISIRECKICGKHESRHSDRRFLPPMFWRK